MFVGRRPDGAIYGLWTVRQSQGQEELLDDHAEVRSFINQAPPQLTAEQKLSSIGLTVADLKALLR
jgi:hypothetical protein